MPNQNRTASLEEDEGFCDSDDADKKLVLSPPEANKNQKQDYKSKKKKKKAQLNKKVSFKMSKNQSSNLVTERLDPTNSPA